MTKAVQQNAFPARFAVVFAPRITRSNTNAAAGGSPRRPLEIGDVRETQPVIGLHAAGDLPPACSHPQDSPLHRPGTPRTYPCSKPPRSLCPPCGAAPPRTSNGSPGLDSEVKDLSLRKDHSVTRAGRAATGTSAGWRNCRRSPPPRQLRPLRGPTITRASRRPARWGSRRFPSWLISSATASTRALR